MLLAVNYSSRIASRKKRLTTVFGESARLLRQV